MAYSLVSSDEVAYMLDLHLFLGQGLQLHNTSGSSSTSKDKQWPSGTELIKFCLNNIEPFYNAVIVYIP